MAKTTPIPTRFDDLTIGAIKAIQARTGMDASEVIRRAVKHTLAHIQETGDISILFEQPSLSVSAPPAKASPGVIPIATLAEEPHAYAKKQSRRKA